MDKFKDQEYDLSDMQADHTKTSISLTQETPYKTPTLSVGGSSRLVTGGGKVVEGPMEDVSFTDEPDITQSNIVLSAALDNASGLTIAGLSIDEFLHTVCRHMSKKQMIVMSVSIAKLAQEPISEDYSYVPPDRRIISVITMKPLNDNASPAKIAAGLATSGITEVKDGVLMLGTTPITCKFGMATDGINPSVGGLPVATKDFVAQTVKQFLLSYPERTKHGAQIWMFSNPINASTLAKFKVQAGVHLKRGDTHDAIESYWKAQGTFHGVVENFINNVKGWYEQQTSINHESMGSYLTAALQSMTSMLDCLTSCRSIRGENNHYYEISTWMHVQGVYKGINTWLERHYIIDSVGGLDPSCKLPEGWTEAFQTTAGEGWVYPVDSANMTETPTNPMPWLERVQRLKKGTFFKIDTYVPNEEGKKLAVQIKVPSTPLGRSMLASMLVESNPNGWSFIPGFSPHNGYIWLCHPAGEGYRLGQFTKYMHWVNALNCIRTVTAQFPCGWFAHEASTEIRKLYPLKFSSMVIRTGEVKGFNIAGLIEAADAGDVPDFLKNKEKSVPKEAAHTFRTTNFLTTSRMEIEEKTGESSSSAPTLKKQKTGDPIPKDTD